MLAEKNNYQHLVIQKIQYQYVSNIDTCSQGSSKQHRVITFNDTADWKDIYFTPGSAKFIQTGKRVDAGKYYEQTLSITSPGNDPVSDEEIDRLFKDKIVVRIEYCKEVVLLLGTKKVPAMFRDDSYSDTKKQNDNMTVFAKSITKAFFLE